MRVTLGSASAIVLAITLCGACSGESSGDRAKASAAAQAAAQAEKITAVGCPVAAPATGCLTIMANGKAYDLAGASPAVDMSRNVGISVTGDAAGGVTSCGVKLTNVKVDYLGLSCGGGAPT